MTTNFQDLTQRPYPQITQMNADLISLGAPIGNRCPASLKSSQFGISDFQLIIKQENK